jgi:prophage antirepressor-like protein
MSENELVPYVFREQTVRTVTRDFETWFVARDVCSVLGMRLDGRTLKSIPESSKGRCSIPTSGGPQELLIVNEPGVYRLIFRSKTPEAEEFQDWVFRDVLPSIRRTGKFDMQDYRAFANPIMDRCNKAYKVISRYENNGKMPSKKEIAGLIHSAANLRAAVYRAFTISDCLMMAAHPIVKKDEADIKHLPYYAR